MKSSTSVQAPIRKVVHRTRGYRHGPIARLMSPSDLGEQLKPFVFLDLFEADMGALSEFPRNGPRGQRGDATGHRCRHRHVPQSWCADQRGFAVAAHRVACLRDADLTDRARRGL